MRALAAVQVVLAHLMSPANPLRPLITTGWYAVDAFFVSSGFLIAGSLLDSREQPDYYRRFFTRRAWRIFPLYYTVLAITTAIFFFRRPAESYSASTMWGSPWWFFAFLGTIPLTVTHTLPFIFGHLWSLQVQEQFYFLFPFLFRRPKLGNAKRILWLLVFLSPALRIAQYRFNPHDGWVQYMLLPCRMEGLSLGALIAIRLREGPWELPRVKLTLWTAAWAGGLALFLPLWAGASPFSPFNRTIGFWISSVANAMLLLWLVAYRDSRLTAVLRQAPFQYVGKISFGVYLLHMLVAKSVWLGVNTFHLTLLQRNEASFIVVSYGLTLLCAAISWRFLENPLQNRGRRSSSPSPPAHRTAKTLTMRPESGFLEGVPVVARADAYDDISRYKPAARVPRLRD